MGRSKNHKLSKWTPKKRTTPANILVDRTVNEQEAFYCCDGHVFSSLKQLQEGLPNLSKETFSQHVNSEKNDFYNWIKNIFQAEKLAKSIQKIKTAKGMSKKIQAHLK